MSHDAKSVFGFLSDCDLSVCINIIAIHYGLSRKELTFGVFMNSYQIRRCFASIPDVESSSYTES